MVNLVKTSSVVTIGEGRRDYSADILFASEPLVRGDQTVYYEKHDFTAVPAGGSSSAVFTPPTAYSAFLFTACASTNANVLIRLVVERYESGAYITSIDNYGYMVAQTNSKAGIPITSQYRVTVYNYGTSAQDIIFYTNGVQIETVRIS